MTSSLNGHFLIAARGLRDPNFFQSVVLIVRHGPEGALGVIVNRPSSHKAAQALQTDLMLPHAEQPLYQGGPVESNALFLIHDAEGDDDAWEVTPNLFVGATPGTFRHVVRAAQEGREVNYRLCAGCAGWAPDQLESELARNDWLLQAATSELALRHDPYELWQEVLQRALKEHRLLPKSPPRPDLN